MTTQNSHDTLQRGQLPIRDVAYAAETGSPVPGDYGRLNNAFRGAVKWVKLEIEAAAPDAGLGDPAHQLQVALTRQ
jgi:hypothetical protein